jgi:arylsulfatase A-like enzyme
VIVRGFELKREKFRIEGGDPMPGKPNILLILADDLGWFDVGAYNRGIMGGPTPNIDRIACEGVLLTDCYAQASCTAGRAAFITGQLPCGRA